METNKLLVTIIGIVMGIFTYWFFLGKQEKSVAVENSIDITVSGGYSPSVITVSRGKEVMLNFTRTDPTDCLEELVLPDFKIRKQLPLNEKVTVKINPQQVGEFEFVCGMNMYKGKILVK